MIDELVWVFWKSGEPFYQFLTIMLGVHSIVVFTIISTHYLKRLRNHLKGNKNENL